MDRILNPEEFFKSTGRMQKLAGLNESARQSLTEGGEERMEKLDILRQHLSDTEILDVLFSRALSDREAEDNVEFVARYYDIDLDEEVPEEDFDDEDYEEDYEDYEDGEFEEE